MTRTIWRTPVGVLVAIAASGVLLASSISSAWAASPTPTSPMTIQFEAGRHVGTRFSSTGAVSATKAATLPRPSTASAVERRSIAGAVHLRVSNGIWAGYWIRESSLAYLRGITGEQRHSPAVRVAFPAGTYLGYRFDSSWGVVGTRKLVLAVPSGAQADMRAVINGRPYVRMVNGYFAGYWIPGSPSAPSAVGCSTGGRPSAGSATVIRSVPAATGEIALTFDIGGRLTPARAILNRLVLDRVCATIFPTGAAAATSEGTAALAIVRAHPELFEVANHTMNHCNLRDGGGGSKCPAGPPTAAFIRQELADGAAVIVAKTGLQPAPYWRPPYGAYDARVLSAAAGAGYTKTFMWSIDTIDWRPLSDGGPTAYDIATKIRAGTSGSIVLLHLGGYNTLDALPYALAGLRDKGLQATSLSDLLSPAH